MQAPVPEVETTQIIVLLTAIAIVEFSLAHTLLGIPLLAFPVRQPGPGHGRAG